MGSLEISDKEEVGVNRYEKIRKIVKRCFGFLGALLVSIVGGMILVVWELKFHQTNTQLWMVPVGLINLVTPVIVSVSSFVTDINSPKEGDDHGGGVSSLNQPSVFSKDNSVPDLEK
ncbi:hypothetical protein RHGRI_001869 [Rhododendron griersonianum]|uniref:Uncharacterized protein n=2 Tax=Rhododendron griersonianum TaxID=479676 RepID=A0AAV6LN31_9ERIC|nr:hypothetical protein RHGRI_001869 [Rhododendron griersonianum]